MTMIKSLDSKVTIGMFLKTMGDRFQRLLASTLTPEEKLRQITIELERQVQEYRVTAREIGAQMRALKDPETKDLEPMEAAETRRAKLIALGGTMVNDPSKTAQLGQLQQEIRSIDSMLSSQQATYATLQESYELARANYQQALASYEQVLNNGSAMLKAIKATQDALKIRQKATRQKSVDVTFMKELETELGMAKAELRSDKQLDADLDATKVVPVV